MAKPNFRETSVISSSRITPNMQRIRLGGEALKGFPENANGGYIKLLFDPSNGQAMSTSQLVTLQGRPALRTYTVRHFDAANLLLDVDFVIHDGEQNSGPAAKWAGSCQPGDTILIGGPGAASAINSQAEHLIFVGDMTALPAISANLEQLSGSAKGHVVIEIESEEDKQQLIKPEGIDLIWVVKPNSLVEVVKQLPWPKTTVSVWAAAEFSTMKQLRVYFKRERDLERENLYISSYWKQGSQEEQHKIVKREDAEHNAD